MVPVRIEVASRSSSSQWAVMCSVSMTPPTIGLQARRRLLLRQQVELALLEVANARREAETEQVAEAEHVIGDTARVGVVLLDRQSGVVIEQAVEDVRRLAGGRRDHLRVERPELVGDVRVERDAWLVAVPGVHIGNGSAGTTGAEVLPVR